MSSGDLASLRRQIGDSFAAQGRATGPIVSGSADTDMEARAVQAAFSGKRWQDVDAAMIAAFKDALPWFTPTAFARFLPAYLVACLDAPELIDTALDSLLYNLTPPQPRRGWRWKYFEARAGLFDASQSQAIAAFLNMQAAMEARDRASVGRTPSAGRIAPALSFWQRQAKEKSS